MVGGAGAEGHDRAGTWRIAGRLRIGPLYENANAIRTESRTLAVLRDGAVKSLGPLPIRRKKGSPTMPIPHTQVVPSRMRRRPVQSIDVHTPLIRQWKLLDLLSSAPFGVTVRELAEATGRSDKTVRRDLVLLRKVGFDLRESVGPYGRKSWRVGQRFERLRSRRTQFKAILDTLDVLLMQVSLAGDRRLNVDLQSIRRRIVRKCRKDRPPEQGRSGTMRLPAAGVSSAPRR